MEAGRRTGDCDSTVLDAEVGGRGLERPRCKVKQLPADPLSGGANRVTHHQG